MAELRFNPTHSVRFDFPRGQIALESAHRLLIPAELLGALFAGAGAEVRKDFGRRLGTELGRRMLERLGEASQASLDQVVDHLGGELALTGLGVLTLERWGSALVLVVTGSPLADAGDELLAALFEGVMPRAFGRDVAAVVLERQGETARFLVVNPTTALRVRGWLSSGMAWGAALGRLHETRSGGGE